MTAIDSDVGAEFAPVGALGTFECPEVVALLNVVSTGDTGDRPGAARNGPDVGGFVVGGLVPAPVDSFAIPPAPVPVPVSLGYIYVPLEGIRACCTGCVGYVGLAGYPTGEGSSPVFNASNLCTMSDMERRRCAAGRSEAEEGDVPP